MELPELGDHCALKDCARLDFLPFGCSACGLTFCLDHRAPKQHGCDAVVSLELTEDQLKKLDAETYACTFAKVIKVYADRIMSPLFPSLIGPAC